MCVRVFSLGIFDHGEIKVDFFARFLADEEAAIERTQIQIELLVRWDLVLLQFLRKAGQAVIARRLQHQLLRPILRVDLLEM